MLIVGEAKATRDSLGGGMERIVERRAARVCRRQTWTGKFVSKINGCGGSHDGVDVPWLFWFTLQR